mgnify:FL=1
MNKKEKEILTIVENMSSIFKIDDKTKNEIFNKISSFNDDEILDIIKILNLYNNDQNELIKKLKKTIMLWKNNLEEIVEKIEYQNKEKDLFNDI